MRGKNFASLDLEIEATCRRNNVAKRKREQQEVQANQGPSSSIPSSSFPMIHPHQNFEEHIMAEDRPQRITLEEYSSSSTP